MKKLKINNNKDVLVPSRNEAFNSRVKADGRTKPVNITLDPQTLGTLDRLCAQYNTSRSALIRAAIEVLK